MNYLYKIEYNNQELYSAVQNSPINISYGSASIVSGGTSNVTIKCANTFMTSDLTIGSKKIKCADSFMEHDIVVKIQDLDYLCFTADSSGAKIGFTVVTSGSTYTKNDMPVLYYSTDKANWSLYTYDAVLSLSANQSMYFCSDSNLPYYKSTGEPYDDYAGVRFVSVGNVYVSGNIMSLLSSDFSVTTLPDCCFTCLFYEATGILSAPTLPALTLSDYCYFGMFYSCTSLTTPPSLPATTLADYCYDAMFKGCSSLTTAPELSVTTLTDYCYYEMFKKCTSLTTAPELPATVLTLECYNSMFYGCTSLTSTPELPATTLADYCYSNMFQNCTSLITIPEELPATTLADYCYDEMFQHCTSLTTSLSLPATTLKQYCYYKMFDGCTNLITISSLPATTLANYCYYKMYSECSKVKMSTSSSSTYSKTFRLPSNGTISGSYSNAFTDMFYRTGGSFRGTPSANTTYYTSNNVIS